MYYYIYDSFLNQKKYEKELLKIEMRLTDLEIKNKIVRLSLLKNIQELIEEGIKAGAETIVAVGNDSTVSQVANIVAHYKTVFGIIPIGRPNEIAKFLGIPQGVAACNVLSARKIESIDMGKINGQYFISSVEVREKNVVLECETFQITPLPEVNLIGIYNFSLFKPRGKNKQKVSSHPQDGIFEAVIDSPVSLWNKIIPFLEKEGKQKSIFPTKKIKISNPVKSSLVTVDRERIFKTPVTIRAVKKKLKVIVGKERNF